MSVDDIFDAAIELSFNTGKGGAWDDRELIKASEAAMKEFHVHHPGPGSWLDKATAALSAGKKLPGADDYGTSWYSASLPDESPALPEAEASTSTQTQYDKIQYDQPTHKKRRTQRNNRNITGSESRNRNGNGNGNTNVINPYAPTTTRYSPSYQPPSPTTQTQNDTTMANGREEEEQDEEEEEGDEEFDAEEDDDDDEEEEEEYDEDAEWNIQDYPNPQPPQSQQNQNRDQNQSIPQNGNGYDQLFPSLGVYPPGGIVREEALGYAMTAQYWAGYWMGVAQSQIQPPVPQSSEKKKKRKRKVNSVVHAESTLVDPITNGEGAEDGSNIKITKRYFNKPVIAGLRR
ncbi:uncharacterized protein IL334_001312 [Kwoniella shivajii]|uniref:Uncharacterized protein n=1 Tax=Kwoniella shivajii TaxID=564305 RepID=A0ABZ1CRX9_9TREE|nr:hypothetical protein IL334_001312 [Kwoniella shivajii]